MEGGGSIRLTIQNVGLHAQVQYGQAFRKGKSIRQVWYAAAQRILEAIDAIRRQSGFLEGFNALKHLTLDSHDEFELDLLAEPLQVGCRYADRDDYKKQS